MAFDSTGNVYVADYGNNRIQVFTAEGQFVTSLEGMAVVMENWTNLLVSVVTVKMWCM